MLEIINNHKKINKNVMGGYLMLKVIIFDMDGVIIDTEPFFIKSENKLLKRYGYEIPEEYHYQFQGTTHDFMWQTMKDEYNLEETVERLVEEANSLRNKLIQEEGLKTIPGVLKLIHHLEKEDVQLAIASSSPLEDIQNTISTFDLEGTFDYIVSGESVAQSKPEPDIFLNVAKKLNVKPENCLVIEDSKNGVLSAKSAGMKVIGFYNQNFPAQDLSNSTKIITNFEKISIKDFYKLFDN